MPRGARGDAVFSGRDMQIVEGRSILIKRVLGSLHPHRAASGIPSLPPLPGERRLGRSLLGIHSVGGLSPRIGETETSRQEKPHSEMWSPWTPVCLSHPVLRDSASRVWASPCSRDGTFFLPSLASSGLLCPGTSCLPAGFTEPPMPLTPLQGGPPPLPPSGPQN